LRFPREVNRQKRTKSQKARKRKSKREH
jgi:hypothetical protein